MNTYIDETIFPTHECKLHGVWTNYELKKAVEHGYEIEDIKYTIGYNPIKDRESPLKQFLLDCYEKRQQGELQDFFYKYIMNNLHGKFAQRIMEGEYTVGDVSDADSYVDDGYDIKTKFVAHDDNNNIESINYLYVRKTGKAYARNFAPILSAYTTAYARDIMYNDLTKIPADDLLYTGTDSILFKGDHLDKYTLGKDIGEYKIITKGDTELRDTSAYIWGKNSYRVGNDTRISGINKETTENMTIEELNKEFQYWKFPTIDRVNSLQEMFKRKYETKDLQMLRVKTDGLKEFIKEQPEIIDSRTNKDD